MNAEASVASENWEKLLSEITKQRRGGNRVEVTFTDSEADLYDFANEVLMRTMRERLVAALHNSMRHVANHYLWFGNKFFLTMNEQEQRSFFHSIFNLPCCEIQVGEATDNSTEGPAITISTSALLETLPQLPTWPFVRRLFISNFALTCQADVQAMSSIILARRKTLGVLGLESIKCPFDDCIKQVSDESNGFFDPLLHAASGLNNFWFSAKTRSVPSTLVSPTAVRALFGEGKQIEKLSLRGLGLTDSHVLAIVDGLSTPGSHWSILDLDSNPGITAQGYEALFKLVNRANVIGACFLLYDQEGSEWCRFCVDDKAWEGKLNLVSEMNSQYGRLEYLTNGNFSSEERRWQWLERVVNLPSKGRKRARWETQKMEIDDTKRINFIWYILRENPEMMRT